MCSVPDCDKPRLCRGMCKKHYTRWLIHGDPLAGKVFQGLSPVERFWQYVQKSDGCWGWTGCSRDGYGLLRNGNGRGVPLVPAHIFSWSLHHDGAPVPAGMLVRHLCDNPPCCRPDHLALGTQADNMRDMIGHGRSTRGERDAAAKLTLADIDEIRGLLAQKVPHRVIAGRFGVSRPAITLISTGTRWGWYQSA